MTNTETQPRKYNDFDIEAIIEMKRRNKWMSSNAIICELNLPIKKARVNRILQQAKKDGLL
ncbi:hypothetical protein [Photobacterium carnosum]|uniref:hypothetical protein n=1 Tax=Photobacterium carnosum TaxID=2023717 RepID=UPI001E34432C|nr:hypothetical protein [Photobacterium carnosum]MCD9498850.1 hypothetical protein [Photobacterium carnosum]